MPLLMPGCFSKFLPNQEKTAGAERILRRCVFGGSGGGRVSNFAAVRVGLGCSDVLECFTRC